MYPQSPWVRFLEMVLEIAIALLALDQADSGSFPAAFVRVPPVYVYGVSRSGVREGARPMLEQIVK